MAEATAKKGKKKKGKTLNLNEFLTSPGQGSGGGGSHGGGGAPFPSRSTSWADEAEGSFNLDGDTSWQTDEYGGRRAVMNRAALPTAPRSSRAPDLDFSKLPSQPPYTAFLGNLPYDVEKEDILTFFKDTKITEVRLPIDGGGGRAKGFGYAEFGDKESLIQALDLNNESLNGRKIRVDVAGNQQGGDRERGDGRRDDIPDIPEGNWRSNKPADDRPPPGRFDDQNGFSGGRGNDFEFKRRDDSGFGSRDGFRSRDDRFGDRNDRFGGRDDRFGGRDGGRDDRFGGRDDSRGGRSGDDRFGGRDDRSGGFGIGWGRDDNRGGRDRGFDDRGGGDGRYGGDRYGGPRDRGDYGPQGGGGGGGDDRDEREPKGRPKLQLQARSKPKEEVTAKPADGRSSIFGAAKPVDTTLKEKEIEEKLAQKKLEEEKYKAEQERRKEEEHWKRGGDREPRGRRDGDDREPRGWRDGDDREPRGRRDSGDREPRGRRDSGDHEPRQRRDSGDHESRGSRDGDDREPKGRRDSGGHETRGRKDSGDHESRGRRDSGDHEPKGRRDSGDHEPKTRRDSGGRSRKDSDKSLEDKGSKVTSESPKSPLAKGPAPGGPPVNVWAKRMEVQKTGAPTDEPASDASSPPKKASDPQLPLAAKTSPKSEPEGREVQGSSPGRGRGTRGRGRGRGRGDYGSRGDRQPTSPVGNRDEKKERRERKPPEPQKFQEEAAPVFHKQSKFSLLLDDDDKDSPDDQDNES